MKNWGYNDLIKEVGNNPTKVKLGGDSQTIKYYYKDITNKVIQVGDKLEIKSLVGSYGSTKVFVGKFLSSDDFGNWCLDINGVKTYVGVNSDLDFDLFYKSNTVKMMVFNTTTKHGFGSMDVHSHDTYVKIL